MKFASNHILHVMLCLACSALVITMPFKAQAEIYPINNPDFELGSPGPPHVGAGGTSYVGNVPGWNVVNAGGVFEPDFISEVSYPAEIESITGTYTAYSQNPGFGLVSQFITHALDADLVYKMTVDVGRRADIANFAGGFGFFRNTNPFATAMSTTPAADPGPGNFTRQTHIMKGADIPGDIGDNFRIGLFAPDGGFLADFDNVVFEIIRPGDANLDGVVNLLDVDAFIQSVSTGVYLGEADTNFDGEVNLLDVGSFIDLIAGN